MHRPFRESLVKKESESPRKSKAIQQSNIARRNSDMCHLNEQRTDWQTDIKRFEKAAQAKRAGSPRDDAKNELKEEMEKDQTHIEKIFEIDRKDTARMEAQMVQAEGKNVHNIDNELKDIDQDLPDISPGAQNDK